MKPMLNNKLLPALGLALFAASALAQTAESAAPDAGGKPLPPVATVWPITANVTLASQYVSRGFQQTWGRPALQGGFDYAHPSGLFAGTWMSNVSNRFIENGTIEWDVYGGYSGAAGDIGYSGTVYYYLYPGAKLSATNVKYDYGELSLGVTYKMLYAKYNYTYTKDFFGFTDARGTGYLDVGANVDIGAGLTLQLHAGQGRIKNWSDYNWKDYKVGLSKAFEGGWTLAGAYTKGTGATNVYDNWAAVAPNSAGVTDISHPIDNAFTIMLSKAF